VAQGVGPEFKSQYYKKKKRLKLYACPQGFCMPLPLLWKAIKEDITIFNVLGREWQVAELPTLTSMDPRTYNSKSISLNGYRFSFLYVKLS
jgi:hypothetical protein